MQCEICKIVLNTTQQLGQHLKRFHNITSEDYYLMFLGEKINCCVCGQPTKFISLSKGYYTHCSLTCSKQSKVRKENIKNALLEKYGITHPMKSEEIKKKQRDTLERKYGKRSPAQIKPFLEKMKKTCLKNYGVVNPNQSDVIKKMKKDNSLRKYGKDYPTQTLEFQQKIIKIRKNNFFKRLITSERLKGFCIPNFDINEYVGTNKQYSWICSKCNNRFLDYLEDGRIPKCPSCYPPVQLVSIFEKEVANFCKQYYPDLTENDRTILEGKELDIYIPEINLAIECNGLYWHSELNGKDKNYHINKTSECLSKGIQLIHIFEDEWYDKQDIIKSILLTKLQKTTDKVFARKCFIKDVNNKISKDFLFENHLQGPVNGTAIGLYYDKELVILLVYGKPRFNKNYDIEILRFCNKKNIVVVGGLSKLLAALDGQIITYCDIRFSTGSGYKKSGFELVSQSPPNYYYLYKNKRYNRMRFQKHILREALTEYDPTLTEWENMQLNGYDRIWDCGNLVLTRNNSNDNIC